MADPVQKISIDRLLPGMYVEDVFDASGTLLFSADTFISEYNQVERFRNQGVAALHINTLRGNGVLETIDDIFAEFENSFHPTTTPGSTAADSEELTNFKNEIAAARKIYDQTLGAVKNLMQDVRLGRMFSIGSVRMATAGMVEGILQNPDAFFGLATIKAHNEELFSHSVNVATIMAALANAMGYSHSQVIDISIGGILHDIGKMRIPPEISKKEDKLTRYELEIFKRHPHLGIEYLKKDNVPEIAKLVILQHHERINGSGYPQGLKGDQIDEVALICALADVYDSLTTDTLYRKACFPQEALALIFQGSDNEYPRYLVERFTKLLGIYPVGSFVKLTTGEMGIVIKTNRSNLLFPVLMILFNADGHPLTRPLIRDLTSEFEESGRADCRVEQSLNPKNYQISPSDYFSSSLN